MRQTSFVRDNAMRNAMQDKAPIGMQTHANVSIQQAVGHAQIWNHVTLKDKKGIPTTIVLANVHQINQLLLITKKLMVL